MCHPYIESATALSDIICSTICTYSPGGQFSSQSTSLLAFLTASLIVSGTFILSLHFFHSLITMEIEVGNLHQLRTSSTTVYCYGNRPSSKDWQWVTSLWNSLFLTSPRMMFRVFRDSSFSHSVHCFAAIWPTTFMVNCRTCMQCIANDQMYAITIETKVSNCAPASCVVYDRLLLWK